MKTNGAIRRGGGSGELLVAACFFVGVFLHVACGSGGPTTSSTDATASPLQSGYLLGATSSLSFATTVAPPPPTPSPSPTPSPEPSPAPEPDGKVKLQSILLAADGPCPGCTLVTRRGSVVVTDDVGLFESTAEGGDASISFEQLDALLRPGVPLSITADATSNRALPVAENVKVDRFFATTGESDVSSATLEATRSFTLAIFDGKLGRVEIVYVLAADAVVEEFEAGERVYVAGVAEGTSLIAGVVRRDD